MTYLTSAEVFETVGLFDEKNFPHNGADHDFYLQCRKNKIPLPIVLDWMQLRILIKPVQHRIEILAL